MLKTVQMKPFKNGVKAACIVEENYEDRGDNNAVEKIRDYQDTFKNVKTLKFAVNDYCQKQRKNKLGNSSKKIPAAVFKHTDILGICEHSLIISPPDEIYVSKTLPVGKAENEVTDDRHVRKNYQVEQRDNQKRKDK